ncbi:hypothetical protein M9H77_01401 [Catharanthus roseus]|uniref:Uncharacterized protein n=1 Tax=Catharanthus roseus TaxID=4058 RepID=A0ACC0C5R8_CATRO|nr:hypothetical protein M9H77_01401 [Catharanthus roseus]
MVSLRKMGENTLFFFDAEGVDLELLRVAAELPIVETCWFLFGSLMVFKHDVCFKNATAKAYASNDKSVQNPVKCSVMRSKTRAYLGILFFARSGFCLKGTKLGNPKFQFKMSQSVRSSNGGRFSNQIQRKNFSDFNEILSFDRKLKRIYKRSEKLKYRSISKLLLLLLSTLTISCQRFKTSDQEP